MQGIKLFVDDIRRCPDDWVPARTVTEAIRILAAQDVKEVSLDHDIGHECRNYETNKMYWFDCKETFEPVAWYIKLLNEDRILAHSGFCCFPMGPCKEKAKIKVTVHSSNPSGAKKIIDILELDYAKCYRPYSIALISEEGIEEEQLDIQRCPMCAQIMTLRETFSGTRWNCYPCEDKQGLEIKED